MIANCGSDENGKYSGGAAGDQTGKEYRVKAWYSRPWNYVLRYPDAEIGEKIAKTAKNAANNANIGYDQSQRLTFYNALKAADWKASAIKTKCEADCSASTAAIVIAVGHRESLPKLQKVSPSCTTSNLRSALKTAGFNVLTDSKYLKSDAYLLPGDILLREGHHVAINLDKGAKAGEKAETSKKVNGKDIPELAKPTLKKGDTGTQVKNLQKDFNYILAAGLAVDGIFGTKTESVLKAFQKKCKIAIDGVYGKKTEAKLKAELK